MRYFQLPLITLLLATSPLPARLATPPAQGLTETGAEPASGLVVCEPGLYPSDPDGCIPLGPSEYLAELSEAGIPYPIAPLPAYTPDYTLNDVPYRYFRVDEVGTPLYASLSDAVSGGSASYALAPGFLYVSYDERLETAAGVIYHLTSGAWIRGDGSRVSIPVFQGLQFSSTPHNSFGWVLGENRSRTAPGLNSPETGRTWYRNTVVQVYDVQQASGIYWLLIGPGEWLDYRNVARVDPRSSPPEGVTGTRWIEINLDEQTLAVYQDDQLVFATMVASGVNPFWTKTGVFQVYEKKVAETMSGATAADRSDFYYLEDVPWTMYYDDKRALHGAYWHNMLGYPRSHGCVNLSIGDSHWLFDWAVEGDYVYVYDPSGTTPTDPSMFGSGAP